MDLVAAVAEAQGWLGRPYSPQFDQPTWRSMLTDLSAALDKCGPRLKAALGADLLDVASATQLQPPQLAQNLSVIALPLDRLRDCWTDPTILVAAWRDLVAGCEDTRTESDVIAHHRDLFWALVSASGRDAEDTGSVISEILGDHARGIRHARMLMGDLAIDEASDWPGHDDRAGLSESERLVLSERFLGAPAPAGHHVVWLALARARLHGDALTIGPLTFYDADWIHSVMTSGGPWHSHLPSELRDPESGIHSSFLPESSEVVFVRVDLGVQTTANPVSAATDLAYGAVAVAKFHTETRNWRPLRGHLRVMDGRLVTYSPFSEAFDEPGLTLSLDGTSEVLEGLASKLGPHLSANTPDLREAIEVLHWWHAAGGQSPLASVLLDVRVVEFVAARCGGRSWHRFLDDEFKDVWIRNTALNRLFDACHDAAAKMDLVEPQD